MIRYGHIDKRKKTCALTYICTNPSKTNEKLIYIYIYIHMQVQERKSCTVANQRRMHNTVNEDLPAHLKKIARNYAGQLTKLQTLSALQLQTLVCKYPGPQTLTLQSFIIHCPFCTTSLSSVPNRMNQKQKTYRK